MKLGTFDVEMLNDGKFWLDGGAMFGVVPKVIWNKLNPADELNRIELSLNVLLIRTGKANILVDTGIGEKVDDKFVEIYRFERGATIVQELARAGLKPEDVDFIVNTHLHFDHAGGNTVKKNGAVVPTFPRAKYVIQAAEWQAAMNPNERTRASYFKPNFAPLADAGQLSLIDGDREIVPGVTAVKTNGHTSGHQSVMVESAGQKAIYFGDLIPTASHIRIPYIMGYDLYPEKIMEIKKKMIEQAVKEKWLLIFEHDPKVTFARIVEENGKKILTAMEDKSQALNPKF